MSDSQFPGILDDDTIINRVDDNTTEIRGDLINSLRSAIFAIEAALGINPQGTEADLATRLGTSLNSDGSIKASALSSIGLVTLPIVNSEIATNAGIVESKLTLDYSTVDLKALIDSLDVFVHALSDRLNQEIYNLNQHVAGNWGRHTTDNIDGYTGVYASYNLQGIVTDLYTKITTHTAAISGAHQASAISVDDSNLDFTTNDVQDAIEQLDTLSLTQIIKHQTNLHGNGILNTQGTNYNGHDHQFIIVPSAAINTSFSVGADSITFSSAQSLSQVSRDDRIDILINSKTYTFNINYTTGSTYVKFFGSLPVFISGGSTAVIYRTSEEITEPSVLALSIRQNNSYGVSIIQLVHPNAPYILSSGLDLRKLSATVKYIKLFWYDGQSYGTTRDIDVYTAIQTYHPSIAALPSAWTSEILATALNNTFRSEIPDVNHYPFIAFSYRGEIGIALDTADGYLQSMAPTSNSAWNALGFSGTEKAYVSNDRRFYIDGYEFSAIRELVGTTGQTVGAGIQTILANLTALGVKNGGIVRVKSTSDTGTYVFDGMTANTLTISEHTFTGGQNATIKIYSDCFSLTSTPVDKTFYEIFLDGYQNVAELRGVERMSYKASFGSSDNPQTWFDVIDISRDFGASTTKRINFKNNAVKLGNGLAPGKTVTDPGPAVSLPITNPQGFRFKLYDGDGINYIELEIISAAFIGLGENAIDVTIYNRISEKYHIEIGTVLHDTVRFKNLSDKRLYGNVGRKNVRDDFTRDYITYPTSLLRGNGIIYGMDINTNSIGTDIVDAYGGQVLVNGIIYTVGAKSFTIPTEGATTTYNLFVDDKGVYQLLKDYQFVSNEISAPSLAEIINSSDKVIVAQITVNSSNIITATGITDLRRFVNNIDARAELLVDGSGVGAFTSLSSAVNYLNACGTSISQKRIIRIIGAVYIDSTITIPVSTILEGDASNTLSYGSQIIFSNAAATIKLSNYDMIKNLLFYSTYANSNGMLSSVVTTGVTGVAIENCEFAFDAARTNNMAIKFSNTSSSSSMTRVIIKDCKFLYADVGIYCVETMSDSTIENNKFYGVYRNAIWVANVLSLGNNIIKNNIISTANFNSAATEAALIKLKSPSGTLISGNYFITTDTGAAANYKAMLHMATASDQVKIVDNTFINTNILGKGFKQAIYAESMSLGNISNNTFKNFTGDTTDTRTIYIVGALQSTIAENIFYNCRASIYADWPSYLNVVNNNINSTGSLSAISIRGVGTNNNLFDNVIFSPDDPVLADLVEVLIYGEGYGIISNNYFEFYRSGTSNHSYTLLNAAQNGYIISNNQFKGDNFIGALNAPLKVGGSNCLITNNHFGTVLSATAGTMIYRGLVPPTDCLDILNKGQTYSVIIPITCAQPTEKLDATRYSSWQFQIANFKTDNVLYDAAAYVLMYSWGNDFVPPGSVVTKIEVNYTISPGATDNLQFAWARRVGFPPVASYVRNFVDATYTGIDQVEIIYPTSPPIVMGQQETQYILAAVVDYSPPYDVNVRSVRVTYKL